jgi:hypothetical protein
LIFAVHEVSTPAPFAVSATATEEPDAYPVPDAPALYVFAERVDPTDGFMAGHPRPVDWEHTVYGSGIGMAYAAGLDAYPYLAWPGIANRLPHELEPSRGHGMHRLIG